MTDGAAMTKQTALDIAAALIEGHEGTRSKPYNDHLGVSTIGIGRNLNNGLSHDEIQFLFHNDIREAWRAACRYTFFQSLSEPRKAAILDMVFQLGAKRFAGFKKMIRALMDERYAVAAMECLDSKYASQVPARAWRIATIIECGVIVDR